MSCPVQQEIYREAGTMLDRKLAERKTAAVETSARLAKYTESGRKRASYGNRRVASANGPKTERRQISGNLLVRQVIRLKPLRPHVRWPKDGLDSRPFRVAGTLMGHRPSIMGESPTSRNMLLDEGSDL